MNTTTLISTALEYIQKKYPEWILITDLPNRGILGYISLVDVGLIELSSDQKSVRYIPAIDDPLIIHIPTPKEVEEKRKDLILHRLTKGIGSSLTTIPECGPILSISNGKLKHYSINNNGKH